MTTVSPENQKLTADIGRRLDQLPVGRTHRKVVVAIGLGLFFEIYEIFLSSAVSTALKTEYSLGGTELKLLLASAFLGMFVGSILLGRLADRIGRRRAFMFNLLWFSGWTLIGVFSPDPWFLVATRFLAGVGVGGEYPVADAYLSDVLPKTDRGRLASWAYTWSFVAVPFIGFLSLGLNSHTVLGIPGWRILLLIGALGAASVAVLRRGLPESPRWLAGVGRADEARAALRTFEAGSEHSPAVADPGVPGTGTDASPRVAAISSPWSRLSVSPYRGRLGMLAVFHLFQSFGYYGFGTLAALVLVSRGYDVTSSLLFTALSFIGYPVGSALAIPLLKLFERKFLLMGTIGALAAFGLLFATVHNTALIVVFGFMTTLTSNVFSNVYHVYQAEIFPTDVRATAVGWTYSLSRLSSGLLPFILIPVLDEYGAAAMFTVVLLALAICVTAIALIGPRTSRRNLEDINPV